MLFLNEFFKKIYQNNLFKYKVNFLKNAGRKTK
jgi:hypothetical protein